MNPDDWKKLHDWLFRVFPEDEAQELYAKHIKEAEKNGLAIPEEG